MAYEPIGREQPSTDREIPVPSPEIQMGLRRQSVQSGQLHDTVPETSEHPKPEVQYTSGAVSIIPRSLDDIFAESIDRKWNELSKRYGEDLEPGESIGLSVKGHSVTVERGESGFSFTVDGRQQDSAYVREFVERNSLDVAKALREEMEQREREERETQRKEQERSGNASRAEAQRYAAQENMKALQRAQKSYDAQIKGDRYVIRELDMGADIDR